MNITKLRSKRVILSTVAVVAALGIGGGVWASVASADAGDPAVSAADRDRAGTVAVQAAGGGTVIEVEGSDDDGAAYEVDVRKTDGTEVEVALGKDFTVLTQEAADAEDAADSADTGTAAAPERVLTDAERTSVEEAARTSVGGGTVTDVEASDKAGVAYEAEVRDNAGADWDVELDTAFKVLNKTADN